MRYCLLFLSIAITAMHCVPASKLPAVKGQLVLHIWIYYQSDPGKLVQVVDSSHCPYTLHSEKEGDGCTRMEFSFRPDPSVRQMNTLIKRLKNYTGIRSFGSTRNN